MNNVWGFREYHNCRCLCINIEFNKKAGSVGVLKSIWKSKPPLLGSARVHIPGLLGLYPPP
jgi:hypothetical protein